MPKKSNLKFYEGYRSDVQFFYKGEMINAIPWKGFCYPPPEYLVDANYPTIPNLSSSNFLVSYKIQNNNFLGASGEPLEALFLAVTSVVLLGGENLDVTLRVAHKGIVPEGGEGYRNFNFVAEGDGDTTGGFKGLTAFGFDDNSFGKYFVGFVGAIASYDYNNLTPSIPVEDVLVNVDIKVVDIGYNNLTDHLFIIDSTSLYEMNSPPPSLPITKITGFHPNVTNFTSVIVDIFGTVYISATEGERNVILVYESASANSIVYETPFDSEQTAFQLRYSRSAENLVPRKRPIMLISQGEGFAYSDNFNASTPPSWKIENITTNPLWKSNVVNDISQQISSSSNGFSGFLLATEGGLSAGQYEAAGDGFVYINSGALPNAVVNSAVFGNYREFSGGGTGAFNYIVGTTNSDGRYEILTQEGSLSATNPSNYTPNFSSSDFILTPVTRLWQMQINVAVTADYRWIGCYLGKGIHSSNYQNSPPPPSVTFSTVSENYDLVIKDFLKADIFTYYFLINERGSSDIDSNTVLSSYDAENNIFISGAPGFFLPSDRLWFAGNTFIFRNTENKDSFYYKDSTTLSIDTLNANIVTSEGLAGLISTTYAGELVDIITTVDQFYLLGSRGIEIWQNVGAAGFPFRKENYLSIPYHLLPLSDEDVYTLPLSRWTYYKGSYVVVCLSNEENVFNLIQIKDGQYKKMVLDQTLWNTLLLDQPTIEDISLNAVNWWGRDYLLLGIVDAQTTGAVNNFFLISEDNRWAKLPGSGADLQFQYLLTTRMNSLQTVYDASLDEFYVQSAVNLGVPPSSPLATPFTVDSIKIEDESEFIILKRILIHVDFPFFDLSLWPVDATYTISLSEDGGRNFSIIEGPKTLTTAQRQVDCSYTKSVLEAIIRFECNYPVIVVGGVAYYEKGGIL